MQGTLMALQWQLQQCKDAPGTSPGATQLFLLKNAVFLRKEKFLVEIDIWGVPESCAIPGRS